MVLENKKGLKKVGGKDKRGKIIFICAVVGMIAVFQYSTELSEHRFHILYQGLFFLPVMLAGFWFGLMPALITSVGITVLLLPFTFMYWKSFSVGDFNNVMELVLYNAVAAILGLLKDRELRDQKRMQEVERLATMGQSVSSLAHDMKTGLAAIGGFSRLLRKHPHGENGYVEKLDIIIGETQRLETMMENMLDFARPLELNLSFQDMNQIAAQSLTVLSEMARERKVRLGSKIAPHIPEVLIDPLRLKQVLLNLLLNAIEASPEGESVELNIYKKRKDIIVDVRDHGCGLPPGRKDKIFSPFFTTKSKGTGLGLPIAKKIVEAHQGILEVIENPVKGVTFRVIIPMKVNTF
jgi:two-component system, NtrC family, sensor histidine kinase HydH